MKKVFISSKISYKKIWKDLKNEYNFNSRWIEDDITDLYLLSQMCIEDIKDCDIFVLYIGASGEVLKDCLTEYGMAIAFNKPIYIVLNCNNTKYLGRFYHNVGNVKFVNTLKDLKNEII